MSHKLKDRLLSPAISLARKTLPFFLLASGAFADSTLTLQGPSTVSTSLPFNIQLALASPAGSEPAGLQWTMTYPASVTVKLTEGPTAVAAGKSLTCAPTSGGQICVLAGINSNILANGTVAIATVTASTQGSLSLGLQEALGATLAGDAVPTSGSTLAIASWPLGDLNQDGKVDVLDLQIIIQQILSRTVAVDFNKDGKTNIIDAQLLIKAVPKP